MDGTGESRPHVGLTLAPSDRFRPVQTGSRTRPERPPTVAPVGAVRGESARRGHGVATVSYSSMARSVRTSATPWRNVCRVEQ